MSESKLRSGPSAPFVPGVQLIEIVGRGSSAVVWKGRQENLGRIVAVKIYRAGDLEVLDRIEREQRVLAQLNHQNIVTLFAAGREDDCIYNIQEFIDGETLEARLRSGKRYSVIECVEMLRRLCDALEYIHSLQIVHRDIKPANIMLRHDPSDCVLIDFSIAKTAGSSLTRIGEIIGTLRYAAPEQLRAAANVGPAADVYAIAAVAFHMLTGRPPLPADKVSLTEELDYLLSQVPDPISAAFRNGNRELDAVFSKAFAKNPIYRQQTVRRFFEEFLAAAQVPVSPSKISLSYGIGRQPRREPAILRWINDLVRD